MKRGIKVSAHRSSLCIHIKTGIFIALSVLSLSINGQNHFMGFKGGFDWTNNAFHNFSDQSNYRSGFSGGLTYEYFIDQHFSVGTQFIYEQRGFRDAMTFMNPDGMIIKNTTHFYYDIFSIPLMAGLNTGKKVYLFANIGLCPALVQNAEKTTSTFSENSPMIGSESYDVTNDMQKFDLSGLFEIGSGYQLGNRFRLYTSLAYQKSFTNLINSDYHSNDLTIKHYGFYLSMGAKYALAKFEHKIPVSASLTNDYFLHKSKKQKSRALLILESGLGIAAIGGLVQLNNSNKSDGWDFDFTGAWIAIAGGGISLISVPFFISSAANARKSRTVSSINLQMIDLQQVGSNQRVHPDLSFKIKL